MNGRFVLRALFATALFAVSACDSHSERTESAQASQTTPAVSLPAASLVTRIAAGASAAYTDSAGNVWSADRGFTGGVAYTQNPAIAIAGTDAPGLFESERYGSDDSGNPASFTYAFSVPNGAYDVTLRFAESYVTGPGQRQFHVAVNGTRVLSNFDIFAEAGAMNRAVDRHVPATVTGGQLVIAFDPGSAQNPKVDAIRITPSTGQPPPPPPPPPPPGNPGQWQEGSLNGMTYALLLPDGFDGSASYPLMLFLHQLQNDAAIPSQIDPWFNGSDFRRRFPAIVVAPRCPNSGESNNWGGVSPESQGCGDSAVAIVRDLMTKYAVVQQRVYVTGNSMGGLGSWDLILRYQDLFAATLIVAGATYDHDLSAAAVQLQNTPIWAVHGSDDTQVPLDWDRSMYAAEQSRGGVMKYTEMQGFGHDVWDTVYPDLTYMAWLFAQSK